MIISLPRQRPRKLIAGLVLVGVVFRSLIPAGFMPSSERPFTLEICPSGLPAQALAQLRPHEHHGHGHDHGSSAPAGHHSGHHQSFEHCPFGSAPGTAPLPEFSAPALFAESVEAAPPFSFQPLLTSKRPVRVQQPRAPPLLDS